MDVGALVWQAVIAAVFSVVGGVIGGYVTHRLTLRESNANIRCGGARSGSPRGLRR
jgi:hypothetical protein